GLFIMAASASEVRSRRMIRSGKRAIRNAVAIDVTIALKTPKLLQVFSAQYLAAIEFFRRVRERIRHPVIHSQIEIAHHKNGRLESFRKIEGFIGHVEA